MSVVLGVSVNRHRPLSPNSEAFLPDEHEALARAPHAPIADEDEPPTGRR